LITSAGRGGKRRPGARQSKRKGGKRKRTPGSQGGQCFCRVRGKGRKKRDQRGKKGKRKGAFPHDFGEALGVVENEVYERGKKSLEEGGRVFFGKPPPLLRKRGKKDEHNANQSRERKRRRGLSTQ